MTIGYWISTATKQLVGAKVSSAHLDAELILAHTLRKGRTFIHAHGDETLLDRHKEIADTRLRLRLDRVPLAYIIGHKEFYGRNFKVTPATLIPRPESEEIINILKEIVSSSVALIPGGKNLVDIGTGSGCLGITAKLEMPEINVTLLDISTHALRIAEENAKALDADVRINRSDLLQNYPFTPDIIVANLPYVDPSWEMSPELVHEPEVALFAADGGLSLIKKLILEASDLLPQGGVLLLEADIRQHGLIQSFAKLHGLRHVETRGFIVWLERYLL